MTQEALIEETGVRLNALPPAKLVVVLDFVSDLVERDPNQAWFWTPEWQAGERQADEDLKTGNFDDFDIMTDTTVDELYEQIVEFQQQLEP